MGGVGQARKTDISERIGRRVKELRGERGWTQAELAERAGLKFQAVSRLERGGQSPTITTLQKIADAFGVEMREPF